MKVISAAYIALTTLGLVACGSQPSRHDNAKLQK